MWSWIPANILWLKEWVRKAIGGLAKKIMYQGTFMSQRSTYSQCLKHMCLAVAKLPIFFLCMDVTVFTVRGRHNWTSFHVCWNALPWFSSHYRNTGPDMWFWSGSFSHRQHLLRCYLKVGAKRHLIPHITSNLSLSNSPSLICVCLNGS